MVQKLVKNWWLLALCGVLEGVISVIYFNHSGNGFHRLRDMIFLGNITLAAGVCTVAAGVWRPANDNRWLVVLNGLALGALGLIFDGIIGFRISFRTVAFLIILAALSIGIFELITAQVIRRRRHPADGWILDLAGIVSVAFALVFFALGLGWIKVVPGSFLDVLWLGSYFGFSAICMLWLAFRLQSRDGQSQEALP
ncbi:MAG TPA: hypothetical protein VFA65_11240 [Bryobacteraceae bacterium]|nr:hypothetical protein [Bryobacteraceae bacterium]